MEGGRRAGRALARALARAAGRADRDARLKGLVEAPEGLLRGPAASAGGSAPLAGVGGSPLAGALREFLGSSRWYVPGVPGPRSARAAVWAAWARARVRAAEEGWDLDHGFAALRILNAAAERARELGLPDLPEAGGQGKTAQPSSPAAVKGGGKGKGKGGARGKGKGKERAKRTRVAALPTPEAGTLLVAHPRLAGYFSQAVVLLVGHEEEEGSYGVVVNKVLPGSMQDLGLPPGPGGGRSVRGRPSFPSKFKPDLNFYLESMEAHAPSLRTRGAKEVEVEDDVGGGEEEGGEKQGGATRMAARQEDGLLGGMAEELDEFEEQLAGIHEDFRRQRVYSGGPVPGFQVLHQMPDVIQGGTKVPVEGGGEPLYVGGECELSQPLKGGKKGSHPKFRLFVGESHWAPGQLQSEIDEGTWIVAKVDGALDYLQLLQGAPDPNGSEQNELRMRGLWHTILEDLGGEYGVMASLPLPEGGDDDMDDAFPMLFFSDGVQS